MAGSIGSGNTKVCCCVEEPTCPVTGTACTPECPAIQPTERELHDEALVSLATFIPRGLTDTDPAGARAMADMADGILQERQRRWA